MKSRVTRLQSVYFVCCYGNRTDTRASHVTCRYASLPISVQVKSWEYLTVTRCSSSHLNQCGEESWNCKLFAYCSSKDVLKSV